MVVQCEQTGKLLRTDREAELLYCGLLDYKTLPPTWKAQETLCIQGKPEGVIRDAHGNAVGVLFGEFALRMILATNLARWEAVPVERIETEENLNDENKN